MVPGGLTFDGTGPKRRFGGNAIFSVLKMIHYSVCKLYFLNLHFVDDDVI